MCSKFLTISSDEVTFENPESPTRMAVVITKTHPKFLSVKYFFIFVRISFYLGKSTVTTSVSSSLWLLTLKCLSVAS